MSMYEKLVKAREQVWKLEGFSYNQLKELIGMLAQIMVLFFEKKEKMPKFFTLTTSNKIKKEFVKKFLEENLELEIQEIQFVDMGSYACSYYTIRLI